MSASATPHRSCPGKVSLKFLSLKLVETQVDVTDKRRTLVRVSDEHRRTIARKGAVPIDGVLAKALGDTHPYAAEEVVEVLKLVSERLRPAADGPILRQLRNTQQRQER